MTLPLREQAKYWSIAALVFFVILFVLGDVILPFVLGMAVAYMLDPVADKLEEWGVSRTLATVLITLAAALVFTVMMLLVLPTMVKQAIGLVETAPALFSNFQAFLTERFPDLMDSESQLHQTLLGIGETIKSKGGELLNGAISSAMSVLNVIVLIVLVPVITFYLLMDWDRMVSEIDQLLPRDHAPVIRRLAGDIDRTMAAFIRGQGTVCLILGAFYAGGLMLVGLQFGLVAGAIAG
ncbi:MAG: putative PurR-regulated permease PerM, partial [Halocynthiibacter sp.]